MKTVSFVVLNWNGEKVITRCLGAVEEALRAYGGPGEVVVVDNASTDGSAAAIREGFPGVRLIELDKNLGFSHGNNLGVRESRGEIVVLVNNDAYLHPGFLTHVVPHFEDGQVFAVAPKVFFTDKTTLVLGRTEAFFRWGLMRGKFTRVADAPPVPCLFATGGSGAFDRRKFLDLGGLLDLLYCEDLELGYRAWKRKGWRSVFESRSLVYHDIGTSFGKVYDRRHLQILGVQNRLLFQWYSITDPFLVGKHFLFLPFLLGTSLLRGKTNLAIAVYRAIKGWKRFREEADRVIPGSDRVLKDREIFRIITADPGKPPAPANVSGIE